MINCNTLADQILTKTAVLSGHLRSLKPRGNPKLGRILADESFLTISNRKNENKMSSVLTYANKTGQMKAEKENCENSALKLPITPLNVILSQRRQHSIDKGSTRCPKKVAVIYEEKTRSTASEVLAKYAVIWAQQSPSNSIFTTIRCPPVFESVPSKSYRPSSLAEGRVDLKRVCSLSKPKIEMLPAQKIGKMSHERISLNPEED